MKKFVTALLDHFESYLCQLLLVFFVVIVFMQIVLRALDMSLPWTEEIARFAFLWFILFGACYATRLCALNRVTMQFMKAPKWIANGCLLAVMDLREFPYATPALDWDLGMVYLVFPLSFLLMAARIIQVNIMKFILHIEIADPDQESVKESQNSLLGGDAQNEGGKA